MTTQKRGIGIAVGLVCCALIVRADDHLDRFDRAEAVSDWMIAEFADSAPVGPPGPAPPGGAGTAETEESIATEVWSDTYDIGYGDDAVIDVALDSQGSVITAGYFEAEPGHARNAYAIKYHPDGTIHWTKELDAGVENPGMDVYSDDRFYSVCVDSADNIIISGLLSGTYPPYVYQMILQKYDSEGGLIWERGYHEAAWNIGNDVTVDGADNVYVAAYVFTDWASTEGRWAILKYDSAGTLQPGFPWYYNYSPSIDYKDVPLGIAVDGAGNVAAVGYRGEALNDLDWHVRKWDASGTLLWSHTFSGAAGLTDAARSAVFDPGGDLFVTGYTNKGTSNSAPLADYDWMTLRYATDGVGGEGQVVWTRYFESAPGRSESCIGMDVDADGNLLITGTEVDSNGVAIGRLHRLHAGTGDLLDEQRWDSSVADYIYGVSRRDDLLAVGGTVSNGTDRDVFAALLTFAGQADCNSNGIADSIDIAGGTSEDCNVNGTPDECDLVGGTSTDLDGDGMPDECLLAYDCNTNGYEDADEIAVGTSEDCNTNGIPDGCDIDGTGNLALRFDGADDFVSVPDASVLSPQASGQMTLEAWVFVHSYPVNSQNRAPAISKGTPSNWEYALYVGNTGYLQFSVWTLTGSAVAEPAGGTVPLGEWHHLAGTYQAGSISIAYVDGEPVASLTPGATPGNGSAAVLLGMRSDSQYLDADIDEVRVWSVARTQEQIQRTMHTRLRGDEPGLVAYWPFDDPAGSQIVFDATANGNDGLRGGSPAYANNDPQPVVVDLLASGDCDGNGIPDDCDLVYGSSADCNHNGIPDLCELLAGSASDCDASGIPDECELAAGTAADCNYNSIPDSCDIVSGTSTDGDGDGVPDECVGLGDLGTVAWVRDEDVGLGSDVAYEVAIDSENNVYVVGYRAVDSGGANRNAYLIKYEPDGEIAWFKERDSGVADNKEYFLGVAVDSQDNVIAAGSITGPSYPPYHSAVLLQKYDPDGVQLWEKIYYRYAWDNARTVAIDSADNIWIAGNFFVSWGANQSDWAIVKFDPNGNVQPGFPWFYNYSTNHTYPDVPYGIAIDADDNVIVVGQRGVSVLNRQWHVRKYSSTGTLIWSDTFSGAAGLNDNAYGVAVDANGDVYVTGYTNKGSDNTAELADYDWLTIKYARDGSGGAGVRLWTQFYDSNTGWSDLSYTVEVDPNGHALVGGYARVGTDDTKWRLVRLRGSDGETVAERIWVTEPNGSIIGSDVRNGLLALAGHIKDASNQNVWRTMLISLLGGPVGDDCNVNGVADDLDIAGGTSLDCNVNEIPDECDVAGATSADCNGNDVPDECDLAGGSATDCNNNDVPDACDLVGGTAQDCNTNGIPDECDIAFGTSFDCQPNGIPDSCETGDAGGALLFDGSNDYVHVPIDVSETAYTMSMWFKTSHADRGLFCVIAGPLGHSGHDRHIYLASGDIRCRLYEGESLRTSGQSYADGQWHQVTHVYGGTVGGQRLYVDGILEAQGTKTASDFDTQTGITIGFSRDAASMFFLGELDDVRIWSAALTGTEVTQNYHGRLLPRDDALIGWWKFDSPEGAQAVIDSSGSGHTGTLGGSSSVASDDPVRVDSTAVIGAAQDCNSNGVPDDCDIVYGTSGDVNGDFIPDECTGLDDCNSNGVWDGLDLTGGTSSDCDGNEIPDECDLAGGRPDCNTNDLPDVCDVPPIGSDPDCQGDGVPDECQLTQNDCNTDGIPDECQLADDCNNDGVPDDCQLTGNDCNDDGVPDDCQLDGNDCNANTAPDDCDVAAGTSVDCNLNGVPDECELDGNDCQPDGVPDDCQLAENDCDVNGVPDECQIAGNDCNSNGLLDTCDLAAGTSEDANGNATPDDCEADLEITACSAGDTIPAGADLAVRWTVLNGGGAPAAGGWFDAVFLSDDASFGSDVLLGEFVSDDSLGEGQSRERNELVTIPADAVGTYWIIAMADSSDVLDEPDEGDNTGICRSVTIVDTQPPQTSIDVGPPDGGYVTTNSVTIGWSGEDNGTSAGSLEFAYCLAAQTSGCDPASATFAVDTGVTITELAEGAYVFHVVARDVEGNIDPTPASRSFIVDYTGPSITAHLPDGIVSTEVCNVSVTFDEPTTGFDVVDVTLTGPSGPIGVTSASGTSNPQVSVFHFSCQAEMGPYEFTVGPDVYDAAGNAMSDVYTGGFSIAMPDLEPANLTVGTSGVAGEQIAVGWTVTNVGSIAAEGVWRDAVYLSDDDQWGGDTRLGEFLIHGPLDAGASYSPIHNVTIPAFVSGTYWIIVVTDALDVVSEPAEGPANLIVSAGSVDVELPPFPDLQVTALSGPPSAWPSQQVDVCWTITNEGNGSTGPATWRDELYLSSTTSVGGSLLGAYQNSASLAAGESYQRCESVTIPGGALGCYHLVLRTDGYNQVFEYRTGLNAEGNNIAYTDPCTDVSLPPPADLVVTMVNGPSSAWSGESIDVTWEVKNQGNSPTPVSFWQDAVFISADESLDPTDVRICTFSHTGVLLPEGTYLESRSCDLPRWVEGDFFVFVLTDSANHVAEQGFDGNNTGHDATVMSVNLTPPPDLEVSHIAMTQLSTSPPTAQVVYEVTNYGGSPTETSVWRDEIWLSVDASFDTTEDNSRIGGPYSHSGALPPDGVYQATKNLVLPSCVDAPYNLFVVTDVYDQVEEFYPAFEDNNDDIYEPITIATDEADLFIHDVVASTVGFSSQPIAVSWFVENIGTAQTLGASITDAVYLSSDQLFSPGVDQLLGQFSRTLAVAAGDDYSELRFVDLPESIDGDFFVFVKTDVGMVAGECGAVANNVSYDPRGLHIELTEPNLVVTALSADTSGLSHEPVLVEWSVANDGDRETDQANWIDAVYFSTDDVLNISTDPQLGSFEHSGALAGGASYDRSEHVTLPAGASGDYYLFVCTDATGVVNEPAAEFDNCTANGAPVSAISHEPNLIVVVVDSDTSGLSGQPVSVAWTTQNVGDRTTGEVQWTDAVYLSADQVYTPGIDTLLGSFVSSGGLAPAETYDRLETVWLPAATVGNYHVVVCTDTGNAVYEPQVEGDNCAGAADALEVLAYEPDLEIFGIDAPTSGLAGEAVMVEWEVRNIGERTTTETAWTDAVYLSTDDTLGGLDVQLVTLTHNGALDVGTAYAAGDFVVLPQGRVGLHYMIVRADDGRSVYELGREENNVITSATPIDIACTSADLRVTAVSTPLTGDAGWPVDVTWTVANVGERVTSASAWTDGVYLSDDPVFNPGQDALVATVSRSAVLMPGESYNRTISITLPLGIEGAYYIFVVTDTADRVEECDNENNNAADVPAALNVGPTLVDLYVTTVGVSESGFQGQPVPLAWTVVNGGDSLTPATQWRDSAYLSLDTILDPGVDLFLGHADRVGPLGPLADYTVVEALTVPASTPAGDYHVLVITDSANHVYEHNGEGNNLASSATTVTVSEPPEADLIVTSVVGPLTASPGQVAAFEWTVVNQGANDALGTWNDSVYLSADQTWDIDDVLVAKVSHSGPVAAAGGSYAASASPIVPGTIPGPLYVIVRCDINDQIPEGAIGETNNTGASATTTDMQIVELSLGVPFDGDIAAANVPYYFQVNVPEGQTLLVTLDAASLTAANELYIRYGTPPDRGHYDDRHDNPFLPDQDVTVPTTSAGNYYILVYGAIAPSPPEPFTILAQALPFGVTGVDPIAAGNAGEVTIEITGARFEPETEFNLVTTTGLELGPTNVYPADQSLAYATFDLNASTPGFVDVVAINTNAPPAVADDLFEILPGGGPMAYARIIAPGSVRAGRGFMLHLQYANTGVNDMPAPLIEVRSSRPLHVALRPEGPYVPTPIRILGVSFDGPAGILQPGHGGVVPVYVSGATAGGLRLGAVQVSGRQLVNWSALESQWRPDGIGDSQWEVIWGTLVDHVGETWGEYEQAMANIANRFWLEGRRVHDVSELFARELELAWSVYPSTITGTLVDDVTGDPMVGAIVLAANTDEIALEIAEAVTDVDGAFELRVTAGQHELSTAGYYFFPQAIIDVGQDEDVAGVALRAIENPPAEPYTPPEEAEIPDSAPHLAQSESGDVHMVFNRGEEIWHARYDGADFAVSGQVAAAAGADARVARAPDAEGADAVTVMWQVAEGNNADVHYTVGRPGGSLPHEFEWANTNALTADVYADRRPALVVTPTGDLLSVWLRKDDAITDDHDVYYDFTPIGTLDWTVQSLNGQSIALDDPAARGSVPLFADPMLVSGLGDDPSKMKICQAVTFKYVMEYAGPPDTLAGEWGVSYQGEYCGEESSCKFTSSASDKISFLMGPRTVEVGSGGKDVYVVDKTECAWRFDNGERSFGGSGKFKQSLGMIPNPFGVPPFIPGSDWGLNIFAGLTGAVQYNAANPPSSPTSSPSSGSIEVNVGGGPYGEVDLSHIIPYIDTKVALEGKVDLKFKITAPQMKTDVQGCFTASFTINTWIYSGKFEWGTCKSEENFRMLTEQVPDGALLVREVYYSEDGQTQSFRQLILEVDPLIGTGNVYPGSTVLADVTGDLTDDGRPALAMANTAGVLAAWKKDSADLADPGHPSPKIGAAVVVATFDGVSWSAPTELADATDFNGDPTIAFDVADTAFAAWPTASAAGYSLSDSAETLLGGIALTDIVFARRIGGVWTAPAVLAALPGTDDDVVLAADGTGRVLAAWLNTGDGSQDETTVYAAMWDPVAEAWGAPLAVVAQLAATDVSGAFAGGAPIVVWSGDADGDGVTISDATLYHSSFDGVSWSAPMAVSKLDPADTSGFAAEPVVAAFESLPEIPDECCPACINDDDCDDGIACTTDICRGDTCDYVPRDENCDDGQYCNGKETCNPTSAQADGNGCVYEDAPCPDTCDESTRSCVFCTSDAQCDDGNACTVDTCDASECRHAPSDDACAGDGCTGAGYCDPQQGCVYGDGLDCGEGDECLRVWCDPYLGCMSESLDCNVGPAILASSDPNEKDGPIGFGDQRWVSGSDTLFYTIRFENLPEATAPAQVVTITDQLSDALDWRTFRVQGFGWGDRTVETPGDRSFYSGDEDLLDSLGLLVRIDAGVNLLTGLATWTLSAIDPATGELPTDATTGFLPPNNPEVHDGEGFVTFTIRTKRNVDPGAVITNAATIIFDVNEPIDTNEVFNTIDPDAPASNVEPLPPAGEDPVLILNWSGDDGTEGSGLADFSVLVSVDGGPFETLIADTTETETTIVAQPGSTYAFYSLARDNAGNVEDAPVTPDAMTYVALPMEVDAIEVNGGRQQRSNVESIAVRFTADTNIVDLISGGSITDEVTLWRRADASPPAGSIQILTPSGPSSNFVRRPGLVGSVGTAAPTQQIPLSADRFNWHESTMTLLIDLTEDGPGPSNATLLSDGNYELRLDTAAVTSAFGTPLPDSDGTMDGVYTYGGASEHGFFRFFGDGTGDRQVDNADFEIVTDAFLSQEGDPAFDPNGDMNGDGWVNFLDLQAVRSQWLKSLPY